MKNIFLSEFGSTGSFTPPPNQGVRGFLGLRGSRRRRQGVDEAEVGVITWAHWPALAFIVAALAVLGLGAWCGADIMGLQVSGEVHLNKIYRTLSANHCIGYLAEANHGLTFLVLAPVFVVLACSFLTLADRALRRIGGRNMLLLAGVPDTFGVLQQISDWNRAQFTCWRIPAPLVLAALGVFAQYCHELPQLVWPASLEAGEGRNIGYVQAPYLVRWRDSVMSEPTLLKRYARLEDMDLRQDLEQQIRNALIEDREAFEQWRHRAAVIDLGGRWVVNGPAAVASGLLLPKVDVDSAARRDSAGRAVHWIFVLALLTMEGTFHGLVVYMVFKVSFFLSVIGRLIPSPKRKSSSLRWLEGLLKADVSVRIEPVLPDGALRYGMHEVQEAYYAALQMVVLGGFLFALQALNTVGNGPGSDVGTGHSTLVASMLIFTLIISTLGSLALGPLLFFTQRLRAYRVRALADLNMRVRVAASGKEKADLLAEEKVIRGQSTWPRGEPRFWSAVTMLILLLVAPMGINMTHFKEVPEVRAVDAVYQGRQLVLRLCSAFNGYTCRTQPVATLPSPAGGEHEPRNSEAPAP